MANVEGLLGLLDEAKGHYQRAVAIYRRQGVTGRDLAGMLENLGVLLALAGDFAGAREEVLAASRMDDGTLPEAFVVASEASQLELLREAEARLGALVSLVVREAPLAQDAELIQACADLVIRRKGWTLEFHAAQRALASGGTNLELTEGLQELASIRMALARARAAGYWSVGGGRSAQVEELERRGHDLEIRLRRLLPRAHFEERLRPVDIARVARALPPGSALIDFLRFRSLLIGEPQPWWARERNRYAAVVLRAAARTAVQIIDLGEAAPIDSLIAKFNESLLDRQSLLDTQVGRIETAETRTLGHSLRGKVFDPVLPALKGCKQLFVVPDSQLAKLSFAALPVERDRHLVDDYQISYLSASRDALRFGSPLPGHPAPSVVAADPDLDRDAVGERVSTGSPLPADSCQLRRLTGARAEGVAIAALLGVKPWLGADVLEGPLKAVQSPLILHLATHAFFLDDPTPEELVASPTAALSRSGLMLAGYNTWRRGGALPTEAEDGILTADDVLALDLTSTELVVLSACETGLGEVRNGEGVFGLRRSFALAGARTLVVSLWKVPDLETQVLMDDFYRRLLGGEGRAQALREAQRQLKQRASNPFVWAGFICQGEPGPSRWLQGALKPPGPASSGVPS